MKAAAAAAVLALAGCAKKVDFDTPTAPPATIKPAVNGDRDVTRWGPDEFGVVCYQVRREVGISCVKAANTSPSQGTQPTTTTNPYQGEPK